MWVAQVLEYDIACQAKTMEAVIEELQWVLKGTAHVFQEQGREAFEGIERAPKIFHELWEQCDLVVRDRSQAEPIRQRVCTKPPAELVPA